VTYDTENTELHVLFQSLEGVNWTRSDTESQAIYAANPAQSRSCRMDTRMRSPSVLGARESRWTPVQLFNRGSRSWSASCRRTDQIEPPFRPSTRRCRRRMWAPTAAYLRHVPVGTNPITIPSFSLLRSRCSVRVQERASDAPADRIPGP